MTIRFFNLIVAVILSALLAWLVVLTSDFADGKLAMAAASFITFATTLSGVYVVKWEAERSGMMCRIMSSAAFVIFLLLNFVFALFDHFSIQLYIILNGVILCIYLLWIRWVFSTKQ